MKRIKDYIEENEKLKDAGARLCHLNECESEGLLPGMPTPSEWRKAFLTMEGLVGAEKIAEQMKK